MYLIYRIIYKTSRRLSHWAHGLSRGLDWLSYKAYRKANFGKYRKVGGK
jgi:hypothetical protein